MSSPHPECPRSPQYQQQQASLPPTYVQPAPGGAHPANPVQYQVPAAGPQQAPYPVPSEIPQQMPPYGQPYYPQAQPRPTDAYAWCMGLIVFMMIPGLGSIVASIAMITVGLRCRRRPEPTCTNGTAAASWGVNYLLATILFLGGHYVALFTVIPDGAPFLPWGLIIMTWLLISLLHVIICIAFGVRASRGRVVPFRGIPFIK